MNLKNQEGGGPGAMKIGSRVPKEAGILSCANIADFSKGAPAAIPEQEQNPYIEAKMTFRLATSDWSRRPH